MKDTYWWRKASARTHRPCLFLDRDGVVVEEVNYLSDPRDVRLLVGVRDLIRAAVDRGWIVGLVTNQAGVGRGYYDWTQFEAVQAEVARQLDMGEEPFDFIAACGAHPEAVHDVLRITDHAWRKPAPGMLCHAVQALDIDVSRSVMIGDQITDLRAGLAAGVERVVHVRTGHGEVSRDASVKWATTLDDPSVVLWMEDLSTAVETLGWR